MACDANTHEAFGNAAPRVFPRGAAPNSFKEGKTMGLFKGIKDMKDMVEGAPALIESAQQLGANAQAQAQAAQQMQAAGAQAYLNAANSANAGQPQPGNLDPISGVTLETYTAIVKSLGASAGDEAAGTLAAQAHGVNAADWTSAKAGWGGRIQVDRAIGARFNALYTQA